MKNVLFILLQYVLPQVWITQLFAKLASSHNVWLKLKLINWFIKRYDIDMSIVADTDFSHYDCFNDFFIRHLKPEARPMAAEGLVSPVDGAVSQLGGSEDGQIIQAKGKQYSLKALLANNDALTQTFGSSKFATIYLSPRDYHRVHMPCDGKLVKTIYVPGKLFSVNPVTAQHVDGLFARNERLICIFETPYGLMAQILVGAMMVAGIGTVWSGDVKRGKKVVEWQPDTSIELKRGDEMGHFKFGSTVILLFQHDKVADWLHKPMQSIQLGEALS